MPARTMSLFTFVAKLQQSEMGEIPAFGKNLDEFSHYSTAAVKNPCGIIHA
jgi:hypothetical protein